MHVGSRTVKLADGPQPLPSVRELITQSDTICVEQLLSTIVCVLRVCSASKLNTHTSASMHVPLEQTAAKQIKEHPAACAVWLVQVCESATNQPHIRCVSCVCGVLVCVVVVSKKEVSVPV